MTRPAESKLPWRVGRQLGFTVYEQVGEQPSGDDRPLAVALGDMEDSRATAVEIVRMRDAYLADRRADG